ncbi:superoxide dismutase family protein [Ichthyenterobacterium sp. W332]|uniref:Superoxide dismutase family protein n=1 Tax=Microcosmobacter mediterraneus TaxID=3075607 RepID=A0ABU2YM82_9FLAO|nr:superoxide dismutase family protein [Ichthyenterobacterium sp. W332]MDT0559152.1 superoxide dismutase family protein [Ichthyenterobacterium sp. W332]
MKKFQALLIVTCLITVLACKKDKKEDDQNIDTTTEAVESSTTSNNNSKATNKSTAFKKIRMVLDAKSGSTVNGSAVFKQDKGVVSMIATFSGLSEGEHAIHLHEKADCSSDDGKSTGGHWNPTGAQHGKWGDAKGYHKGDIGNFTADANGNGYVSFNTDEWCIGCGDETMDILGKALIVHQGTDDFTSQPSGAAGSRVSCGGIVEE